jgi:pre-mRNA-splicing factor CWC22
MSAADDSKEKVPEAASAAGTKTDDAELEAYMRKKREGQTKSGGVYMPPFRLAALQQDVKDKKSRVFQRLQWDALRKSINGLINKVCVLCLLLLAAGAESLCLCALR